MNHTALKLAGLLLVCNIAALGDSPGAGYAPPGQANTTSQTPSSKSSVSANAANSAKPDAHGDFYIYEDKGSPNNHYAPSGWMGDSGDLQIDDGSQDSPKSGTACLKIFYSAKGSKGAHWAGIFWQDPANNWGTLPGGFDLSHYKKMTFWARGAKGGEKITEFKVGGITGQNGDSDSSSIGPVSLTKDWKKFTIDLSNKNLSHIIGGFGWSANHDDNPQGITFYLDDIRFES